MWPVVCSEGRENRKEGMKEGRQAGRKAEKKVVVVVVEGARLTRGY